MKNLFQIYFAKCSPYDVFRLYVQICPNIFIAFILFATVSIFIYYKWKCSLWNWKKVSFEDSWNPQQSLFSDLSDVYNRLKSQGHKHGVLASTALPTSYIPIDPEYIKNIIVKDFNHFETRGSFNESDDSYSAHMVLMETQPWRNMKIKLTPTFTSEKLENIFQILKDCFTPLQEEIDQLSKQKESLDIKELVARFTTDIVDNACNSLENSDTECMKYGKQGFTTTLPELIIGFLTAISPYLSKAVRISRRLNQVSSFFNAVAEKTVTFPEEDKYPRQLLINIKHSGVGLTIREFMAAQGYIFFMASFETSSTIITYCLYELSINQDVQDALRQEIETVLSKHQYEISYESIQDMTYLSQVIDETLRKYPLFPVLQRICNKAYKVPGTDLILEKGSNVFIPVYRLHHDADYYPEPENFDPGRFSGENRSKAVPCTYLPFGEGPKMCTGLRFGLLQTKIGLVTILKYYKLTLNKNTPEKLTMDSSSLLLTNLETILLNSEKITES